MNKRAVVLAGGGSRGSYQVGVWRALREIGWEYQIVTGTSVGALNGALMVQDDFDLAVQMWETISTTDVLSIDIDEKMDTLREMSGKLGSFLSEMAKNGGVDPRPLEDMLRRYVDEERIRASEVDFAVVTVEYPSMAPRVIDKSNMPEGGLVDYLMASAACFPAMKMRQIGEERFIDGGYHDNMPVNLAIEHGAREIVAVDLESIGRKRRTPTNKSTKIYHIRSRWDLGVFLLFDKEVAKRNMRLGYLDALKAFGKFEGEAYTFHNGETSKNAREIEKYFDLISIKTGLMVREKRRADSGQEANVKLVSVTIMAVPQPASDGAIAAAGETAARLFDFSPLEVHTFDELNEYLCGEVAGIIEKARASFKQLSERLNPKELLSALGQLDKRFAAVFCMEQVRRAYSGEDKAALLKVLSKLAPDLLAAACYLFALELSGRMRQAIQQAESEAEQKALTGGESGGADGNPADESGAVSGQ